MKIYQLTTVFTFPGLDDARRDARTKLFRIHRSWRISFSQPRLISSASRLPRHKSGIPTISTVSTLSSNLEVSFVLHGGSLPYAGVQPLVRTAPITYGHTYLAIIPAHISYPGMDIRQCLSHHVIINQNIDN